MWNIYHATIIRIHIYNEIELRIMKNYPWDVPLEGYFYISFIYAIDRSLQSSHI